MAEHPRELLSYLKEAHALEQMSLQMTQAATKATDDRQLQELFEQETEEHERLIRERIEAHGESTSKIKISGAASPRWARAWSHGSVGYSRPAGARRPRAGAHRNRGVRASLPSREAGG